MREGASCYHLRPQILAAGGTAPNARFSHDLPLIFAALPAAYDGTMPDSIYLDHNATTPVLPEVIEAMRACWAEPYLNPASQHEFGRRARRKIEDARDHIAELLGANLSGPKPDRVIFTSGGTEANNLALRGLLRRAGASSPPALDSGASNHDFRPPRLLLSTIEHLSITILADHLAQSGHKVDKLGVSPDGVLLLGDLPNLLAPDTRLVAGMLANNETGVIQPVAEMAAVCNSRNIPFHTDATQAAGKLAINFQSLGAATMTIAAHKLGGPIGIGALLVRSDIELPPLFFGGFQQAGIRPGTESVALAVGLCTALDLWQKNRAEWPARLQQLRDHFEARICGQAGDRQAPPPITACQTRIIGAAATRLPNTSNIAFEGLDRQALFIALDQAGVACSTGSACASGSSEPSPVHIAMGFQPAVISGSLRFSFGIGTTRRDVDEAADRIIKVCNSLGR